MPTPRALGYRPAVVDPELFQTLRDWLPCPLYHELGPVVAKDPELLTIAAQGRPGQMPVTLFFSAVHYLLLAGNPHELRDFYPSVVGSAARPPTGAGPVFVDFVRRHRAEVEAVMRVRLVQRHVVLRAAMLRLGMSWIGRETDGPIHLVEVGASAGALLRFDRYRYEIGGHVFGDHTSTVTISPQWKDDRVPDLDAVPPVASAVGIDLHPVDPSDPDERRWLHALVWPDDQAEHLLLDAALAELIADPPRLRQGDAIDLCPIIANELPAGAPRVVFHAAVRMHVPPERQPAFDAALATLGHGGPFYHLFLEPPEHGEPQGLVLRSPRHPAGVTLTQADGYARWIGPLAPAN
jgi:hypothetical protein